MHKDTYSFKYKALGLFLVFGLAFAFLSPIETRAASTPAFVQQKSNLITSGANNNVSFTSANKAGNLIVVYVVWDNNGPVSLSDTRGNVYQSAVGPTNYNGNTNNTVQIFYAKNIIGGSNTVKATFGTSITTYGIVYINEYSGIDTVSPVDVVVSGSGSASAMTSGSVTTRNASDLLFGAGESYANVTRAGTNYTLRSNAFGNIIEDRKVTATGSYAATATQNGNGWIMQMVAFKAAGSAPDTTSPSTPANLTATSISPSQINLSWTASTDNIGVTGYKIFRAGTQIATTTTNNFSNTGLNPNTNYTYTVSAFDAAGNVSSQSASANATTQPLPPAPSINSFTASPASIISSQTSTLTWNVSNATSLSLDQGIGAVTGTSKIVSPAVTTTYTLTATNSNGSVSSQTTVSVSPDAETPSIPTNLTATSISPSQINLSWTASTDNIGVTGYKIFRAGTQIATTTTNNFSNTGLNPNTNYTYTVSAFDAAGNVSSQSASANATTQEAPAGVNWPLRLSSNGKYLEDQSGNPYLLVADAGWGLITQISDQDAINYIDNRKAKGFNAVEMMAIVRAVQTNYYGQAPFVGGPSNWSTPNEAYWVRVDNILSALKDRGMVAVIFPAYLGYGCNEGWCQDMISQSDAAMTSYGQWIGNRYKDYGNVIWMTGGDVDAYYYGSALSRNNAVVSGIRSVDSDALFSVEPHSEQIGGVDSYTNLLDINSVYTYGMPQSFVERAHNASKPFIFQEGYYENEHGTSIVDQQAQALITYLGGGIGHIFGSCPLWSFGGMPEYCSSASAPFNTWQNNMNSPGSISMGKLGKLMQSRKWWTLVPDYSNTVVTSNKGNEMSYQATAREATGETIMVWSPGTSQITVDMTKVSGTQARGWWFNVSDGTYIDLGTFSSMGMRNFTPPNSRMVLVLDDASLGLAAPGATVYTTVPDTTAPTSPTNLSAIAVSSSQINLSWSASSDDRIVSGYRVYRDGIQIATTAVNNYSDIGLSQQTSYTYTLEAYDSAGNVSPFSSPASATTLTSDVVPPSVPQNLNANASVPSQIDLSWNASTDNSGNVQGYKIFRDGSQIATSNSTNFTDTNLLAATTYSYNVAAFDASLNTSAQSLTVSTTTLPAPITPITIGETTVFSGDDSGNGNLLLAQDTVLSQNATIQSLSFYIKSASGNLRLGIYDAIGPNGGPGTLKAQTNSFIPTTGWNTVNVITPVFLAAGNYWLSYLPSSNNLHFATNFGAGSFKYAIFNFGSMPTTFPSNGGQGTTHWSLYGTLTP